MAIRETLNKNNLFDIDRSLALKMFGLSDYIQYMLIKNPYMKTVDYFKIREELFEDLSISELNLCKKMR